jgi:hypothetical protein
MNEKDIEEMFLSEHDLKLLAKECAFRVKCFRKYYGDDVDVKNYVEAFELVQRGVELLWRLHQQKIINMRKKYRSKS